MPFPIDFIRRAGRHQTVSSGSLEDSVQSDFNGSILAKFAESHQYVIEVREYFAYSLPSNVYINSYGTCRTCPSLGSW